MTFGEFFGFIVAMLKRLMSILEKISSIVIAVSALGTVFLVERQLRDAKETAHLDQRAWVATVEISGNPLVEGDNPFHVAVKVKNSGKTFAKDVKAQSNVFFQGQSPLDLDKVIPSNTSSFDLGLLPPNGDYTMDVICPSGPKEIQDGIRSGRTRVLVSGRITYTDIFNCSHWTNFSYVVWPNGKYWAWGTGNDADDNHCEPVRRNRR
jgi:hypothetical protein